LHHVVLEKWSRGASGLHRRDPRVKMLALLIFLVVVATAHTQLLLLAAGLLLFLGAGMVWARLPIVPVLLRATIVLYFTAIFAVVSWLSGDPERAVALLVKTYLSALAVLLVVSTTRISVLLQGLEMARVPRFLLMIVQFLYRYLFVISEEAQHMRKAALSRGAGLHGTVARRTRFQAAAGALAALFARSYGRAEDIHRAMLSRGFTGEFRTLETPQFRLGDVLFFCVAGLGPILLRVAAERAGQ
jgi:cobalt/nickel transport system permease protein